MQTWAPETGMPMIMMVTQLCYGYLTRRLTLGQPSKQAEGGESNDWQQTQSRGTSGQLLLSPGGNFAGNLSSLSRPSSGLCARQAAENRRNVSMCVG